MLKLGLISLEHDRQTRILNGYVLIGSIRKGMDVEGEKQIQPSFISLHQMLAIPGQQCIDGNITTLDHAGKRVS